jgi:hypothetical protein
MRFARQALVLVLIAASAYGGRAAALQLPFRVAPPVYLIEGYIDRAADESKVIDRVDVTAPDEPVRWLLVTSYRALGGVLLHDYLSRVLRHPWLVRGRPEEVARLLKAPAGTKVEATFLVYPDGVPSLFIADLDSPPA